MGDEVTKESLAETVATFLQDRDDIATAEVLPAEDTEKKGVAVVGVETQGGAEFFLEILPA